MRVSTGMALGLVILGACCAASEPLRIANARELFVDDAVLDTLERTEVRLGAPAPAGLALKFDAPWEGRFCAFVTVLREGAKYRMYYRGAGARGGSQSEITCYADSDDGKEWRKPKLGLVAIDGSKENNVLLDYTPKRYTHNFTPMIDDRPGVPAEERYKAVGGGMTTSAESKATGAVRGLYRLVSADGIRWRELPGPPLFTGYAMDTQNVLVWLPAEQCYAVYLRTWTGDEPGKPRWRGIRLIARTTSKDFVHWTTPEVMTTGDAEPENLYTNATHPYFRAPQILISLPFRFAEERQVLPQRELEQLGVDKSMWKGVSDAVLMTSRGGNRYDRKFRESFVRPGSDRINWAARSNMPALGVVETGPNEMSMYLVCRYGTKECQLERRTLRLDGFAALHAGYEKGFAVTRPLQLEGAVLRANFATSSIGYVKITVLDQAGREIPGFAEADAEELAGDEVDRVVKWKSGKSIAELRGRSVRLKFSVRDADVYSFGAFER